MRIGLDSSCEAFRVIEPIDADHQRAIAEALVQAPQVTTVVRGRCLRGDRGDIDTDRKDLRAHNTAESTQDAAPELLSSGPAQQVIAEAVEVRLGLKPDEIIGA